MNRRQRRANPRPPAALLAFARAYQCPDCLSENAEPVLVDPSGGGVWRLEIRHDETCPTYRSLKARGLAS